MNRKQFISHVEATQQAFRRFLVAICCGDTHLADDIAQESLIKAYLSCDCLADAEKFKSWLYRIGYNTFINYKRTMRQTVDEGQANGIAASDAADNAFRYQELYAALKLLPEKERIAILLFYIENYSVKEIADIVASKQDAVRQHLFRGRMHLRGLLTKD